jgi:hypothetical protein
MTNIRLRIEDTIPNVGFGPVGTPPYGGTGPAVPRGGTGPVAYRMAPVTPAAVGTI